GRATTADRRGSRARRARDGDPERAYLPRMARRLPAHRAPRRLRLLRGVRAHRRLDVQPACEVARGGAGNRLAAPDHDNLHVRVYKQEATTTTPFDMLVRNDLDRFHLVMDVADRVAKLAGNAAYLKQRM